MIVTERLSVRSWRDEDVASFHAMNQDPEVIRFLYDEPPTIGEVGSLVERLRGYERDGGRTFWAIERLDTGEFVGFCGVKPGPAGTPIEGAPEIGWRIARPHWRCGFAHEAARACLDHAWADRLPEVAAITVPENRPSRALMEKLGMRRDPAGDFDHPGLPPGHRLARHVLYRIQRPAA